MRWLKWRRRRSKNSRQTAKKQVGVVVRQDTEEVISIMVALYDEQEVMERYVSNRVNTAVKSAVESAVKSAVESAVSNAELEKAKRIASNMLALGTMSNEDIAKCTGLSVSEIEALSNLSPA